MGALMLARAQSSNAGGLDPATSFYVPKVDHGSQTQFAALTSSGDKKDAALINAMVAVPQAVWFTGGTPHGVQQDVKNTVSLAQAKKTVPVLVAYNVPYRDCSQYSAGGAASPADYEAWIDGFAAGIGDASAIVILEPDSLGIIPWYNPFADRDGWVTNPNYEWCQPADANPATAASDRMAIINYAVDKLKANPGTHVYLDGTHSGWLGAGDAADRLLQAGVKRADGFFLNASNYQSEDKLERYAPWVSKCIWFADPTSGSWGGGHAEWCASQYFSPNCPVDPNDISTWHCTDEWYAGTVEIMSWVPYPGDAGLKHYVIDTSRNGNGPLNAAQYGNAPYNQTTGTISALTAGNWCNPPGAGLGLRPTANTSTTLLDAYLWVKIPGESDGQCDSAGGARAWNYNIYNPWYVPAASQSTFDPLWGMVDPGAGAWFSQQALQLAQLANPPLVP
jgi:endoglucanase